MQKQELCKIDWRFHQVGTEEWIKAEVPGSVYADLIREGRMEDPFWKDNEDAALKLMDEDYEYVSVFDADPALFTLDRILLRFDGLDTLADVSLNGTLLGNADNMHRVWEYDVTNVLRESKNELKVLFHSPTKWIADAYAKAPTRGTEDAMPGFVHLRKAHCMFGWDWGAHLPDAGIWRPVSLLGIDQSRIDSVQIEQIHEAGAVTLKLAVEIDSFWGKEGPVVHRTVEPEGKDPENCSYLVRITSPDGIVSEYEDAPAEVRIEEPKLWWPNGYGEQPLYTVEVALVCDGRIVDTQTKRIGLRTLTMDRSKYEYGEKFHTTVNGVAIFAMGADYIPEDHIISRVTPETTRTLMEKAVFANFNSIRVWGGGYYPDDWFYDICDELGLLVWQDCMFACGVYDLTPEFEASITAELRDNIKRIRSHASLAILCGNNEMEDFVRQRVWVSKDEEVRDYVIMYERLIKGICAELAPQVFYWPSSPSSGGCFDNPQDPDRGDVHYWMVWHGDKPFSEYRKFYFRYLSEFGFQAFPSEKTIETFTDDPNDKNIFSYIMEKHQRNGSANGKIMNYMQQTYRYPTSFDKLIYASQLLQADAIRYGVEHFRRNRGRCMGAVYWQFNDCWPVASWSSIDYCQRLKALHYAARRFFAPWMISCEEHGMIDSGLPLNWLPSEFEKSFRLNVANETLSDGVVTVKWQLRNAKAEILREESCELSVPALSSVWMEKVDLSEIDLYGEYVSYQLIREGEEVSQGTVIFSYPKYFRYEDPQLSYRIEGNLLTVSASAYAKSVEILNENEDLILSDNYFDLNADEKTVEILSGDPSLLRLRSVYDIG